MSDVNEATMLDMSDDDILNMSQPPELTVEQPSNTEGQDTLASGSGEETVSGSADETVVEQKEEKPETSEEVSGKADEEEENPLNASDADLKKPANKKKEEPAKAKEEEPAKAEEAKAETPAVAVDHKDFFEKITAPFKASGRQMQVKTPEEAIALMQRGADYTKKMQVLKPSLKLMKMLENNGLLDETKLSHFIDLDKKDPAAIAKFLKDKEIDPLDLDMSEETQYKPTNHAVSDDQMRFNEVLEDVQSTPFGKETVQIIDKQWDKVSQGRVYKEPKILELINTHRETGIYDQVISEVDRLKLLNVIPEDAIFLDAYKTVADELHKHGRLLANGVPTNQKKQEAKPATPPVPAKPAETTRQPIETRAAKPKPAAVNGEAARAAGTTRTTPAKPAPDFNPLAMSDEEFEKQAGNFRL